MARIRIGISGWTYAPWRGNFYPKGLPHKRELAFASRRFDALEVNGTFYSLQRPATFDAWYEQSPRDFVFALKAGRFITHMRKIKEPQQAMANFFASGLLRLREKLGPILWQFPAMVRFDEDRFKAFFDLLPRNTVELSRLAKKHAAFLKGRNAVEPDAKRTLRHAVEFRHESFLDERFIDLCRRHRVAVVVADVAGRFPTTEDVTSDFVYVRLHGSRQMYTSGYSPREIRAWAGKVRAWSKGGEPAAPRRVDGQPSRRKSGRDVYVFFDNTDVKLRAPVDAHNLAQALRVGPDDSVRQVLEELGVEAEPAPSA